MRAFLSSILLISCARLPPQPWTHVGPSRVLEIVTRRQCSVCHSVESVFGSTSSDEAESSAPTCQREGHCAVPTLASIGRFRAKWLREFLEKPVDLRPGLAEQMIPHALSPPEIDALITGWGAVDEPGPAPRGELASGERLFEQKQCGHCHHFGARPLEPRGLIETAGLQPRTPSEVEGQLRFSEPASAVPRLRSGRTGAELVSINPASEAEDERVRALAPDLRHARHRLTLATLERFIFSPASVKPTSAMPRPAVTLDEAQALARYVYFSELP